MLLITIIIQEISETLLAIVATQVLAGLRMTKIFLKMPYPTCGKVHDTISTCPEKSKLQFNLGNMYYTGEGVPQNDIEAVRWYRMAAEQGYIDAQFNLGFMYNAGAGVPQNDIEARKNLKNITKKMTTADIAKAQELSLEYWEAYGPNRVFSE